jgi:hypothetical protein
MSIPASTVTAARAYLFSALTAQLQPDPVNTRASLVVCYDIPGPNQPDDIVAIGRVTRQINFNSLVGGGGAGWLEERYALTITVDVFRAGDEDQAAYTRAAALSDAICAVVRTDPSLGGIVLTARPLSDDTEVEWDDAHMGKHATCELQIECFQRI